jgi:hypothetical protein
MYHVGYWSYDMHSCHMKELQLLDDHHLLLVDGIMVMLIEKIISLISIIELE